MGLGGRELTLLCGFNQYTLYYRIETIVDLGTSLYCSLKLGGRCPPNAQVGGAPPPPAPPVEPPLQHYLGTTRTLYLTHLSSLTPKKRSGAENSPSSKMFAKSAQDCTVISCHLDAMHSCGRREQCARNTGALHKFSAAYGPDPRFSPPPRKRKTTSGYPRLGPGGPRPPQYINQGGPAPSMLELSEVFLL